MARKRYPLTNEPFDEDLDRRVDDLLSFPIEQRVQLLDELDIGAIPGDEAVREQILSGHRSVVERIARERVGHGLHREPKFGRKPPEPYDPDKLPFYERFAVDPQFFFRTPVQPVPKEPTAEGTALLPELSRPGLAPLPEELSFGGPGAPPTFPRTRLRGPTGPLEQPDVIRPAVAPRGVIPAQKATLAGRPQQELDTGAGFLSSVAKGVKGGAYQLGASAAGTIERLQDPGQALKPIMAKVGQELADEAAKYASSVAPQEEGLVQQMLGIVTDPDRLGNLMGNVAVQTAPSLAAFATGTLAGGPAVGTGAMLATIYFQQAGDTYREALQRYRQQGLNDLDAHEKAYYTSGLAGLVSGVVNSLAVPASMVEPFTRKLTNLAFQYIANVGVDTADQLTQNIVAQATYAPERALTEGLAETIVGSAVLSSPETMATVRATATGPGIIRPVGKKEPERPEPSQPSDLFVEPAPTPRPGAEAARVERLLPDELPVKPPSQPFLVKKPGEERAIQEAGIWVEPKPSEAQPPVVPEPAPVGLPAPPEAITPAVEPQPAPAPLEPIGEAPAESVPLTALPLPAPEDAIGAPGQAALPVILGVDLNQLTGTEPEVEAAVAHYGAFGAGFDSRRGKTLGAQIAIRQGRGLPLWENMSRLERLAEFRDRLLEDITIAKKEAGTRIADYLVMRALDPLDPMAQAYKAILQRAGATITETGGIKLPKELQAQVAAASAVPIERLVGLMNMARQSGSYEEFLQVSGATPEELTALSKHFKQKAAGRKLWQELRTEFTGEVPGIPVEPSIGGPPAYAIGDVVEWVDEKGRPQRGTVRTVTPAGELEIEAESLTELMAGEGEPPKKIIRLTPGKTPTLRNVSRPKAVAPAGERVYPTPEEVPHGTPTRAGIPTPEEAFPPAVPVGPPVGGPPAEIPTEARPEAGAAGEVGGVGGGPRPGGEAAVPGKPAERPQPGPGGRAGAPPAVSPVGGRGARPDQGPVQPVRQPESHTHATVPHDYQIKPDDPLELGGPMVKARRNLAALKLLKQLEADGRLASPEEQVLLVQYSGWGGIKQAFNRWDTEFEPVNTELRQILTDDEYGAAERSTENAHYTSPGIIMAVYHGLDRLGFKGGRILEPAVGIGHFFGMLPPALKAVSPKTGVELDALSARIAKQLYQTANIHQLGFEDIALPDNFFDLAVGNVPFSEVKPYDRHDRELDQLKLSLHDYFFAKALKKVRPGGLIGFITSRYTLDKISERGRRAMTDAANLIGAVRLPNDAFGKIAGTAVVTDLVILQKRPPGTSPAGENWRSVERLTLDTGQEIRINEYFIRHPEMVLGKLTTAGTMYRANEPTVASDGRNLQQAIIDALNRLPANIVPPRAVTTGATDVRAGFAEAAEGPKTLATLKEGDYLIQDGKAYYRQGSELVQDESIKSRDLPRLQGLLGLRDQIAKVFDSQLNNDYAAAEGKVAIDKDIKLLDALYSRFTKRFGYIHDRANEELYGASPEYPLLKSLEKYTRTVKTIPGKTTKSGRPATTAEIAIAKGDIFFKPVIARRTKVERADTAQQALLVSLNETGGVNLERIGQLTGQTIDQAREALRGLIFNNPEGGWETADAYLSGNVKQKLATAEAAAKQDAAFQENVGALKKVQPADLPPSQISVLVGNGWIPNDVYELWLDALLRVAATVRYNATVGAWHIQYRFQPSPALNHRTWGTPGYSAQDIVHDIMHSKQPTVYDTVDGKRILNEKQTEAAREKADAIQKHFAEWVWKNGERAERLTRIYNDAYNGIVLRKWDGAHLELPGTNPAVTLRPHQKDVIWRALQSPTTYIAHVVGAGKTYAGVAIALEHRRLGLAKKPMVVVPNHLIGQWGTAFQTLYPSSRVLAATEQDFDSKNRLLLLSKIATGDWDAVIVPKSSFGMMPVTLETYEERINAELDMLREFLELEGESGGGRRSNITRELVKAIKRLETKLQRRQDQQARLAANTIFFEQTGVDLLVVDEADLFKNLFFPTRMTRVPGLPNSDSLRAFDMYLKTRHVMKLNNGRGVVFMSGTPISNTIAEAFIVQRYLQPDQLKANQLEYFDAWARQFGRVVNSTEMDPTGRYKLRSRFAEFVNVPELFSQVRSFMDVKTNEDLNLDIPKIHGGKPRIVIVEPSEALKAYTEVLLKRAERVKNREVRPEIDNMLKIVNDGKLAALDVRLRVDNVPDEPASKVNTAVKEIAAIYKQWAPVKGFQIVFLDLSTPKSGDVKASGEAKPPKTVVIDGVEVEVEPSTETEEPLTDDEQKLKTSVYRDIKTKLIKAGVKAEEIAFMHDYKTSDARDQLYRQANNGEIRVLLTSTEKGGAGTNVQKRMVALHHIDQPWRPRDIEQREGRGIRQGNLFHAVSRILTDQEAGKEVVSLTPEEATFLDEIAPHKDLIRNFELQIVRYATKAPSFDLYMWQTLESKKKAIETIMRGDESMRTALDADVSTLSYSEMKAAASGNPLAIELVGVDAKVRKLSLLRHSYHDQQVGIRRELASMPARMQTWEKKIADSQTDIQLREATPVEPFTLELEGQTYSDKEAAGEALLTMARLTTANWSELKLVGFYRGFNLGFRPRLEGYTEAGETKTRRVGELMLYRPGSASAYEATVRESASGAIQSIQMAIAGMEKSLERSKENLAGLRQQVGQLEEQLNKPFEHEDELQEALKRQEYIRRTLGMLESDAGPSRGGQEDTGHSGRLLDDLHDWTPELAQKVRQRLAQLRGEGPLVSEQKVTSKGVTKAVAAMDPRLMKVLGSNLYQGDAAQIAVKELLQNALDSVRALADPTQAVVRLNLSTGSNTIGIEDNGPGMLPDVATNELVDIGGSRKVEGATGGFGVAKVAIFSQAQHISVSTIAKSPEGRIQTTLSGSGEDWIDPKRGLTVETAQLPDPDGPTGTEMEIRLLPQHTLHSWAVTSWLMNFMRHQRLPYKIEIKSDGGIYDQAPVPTDPLTELQVTGAVIELSATHATENTNRANIVVLNQGIPQFDIVISVPDSVELPKTIVANVRPTVTPENEQYPFAPDRERLKLLPEAEIKRYIRNDLFATLARKERARYQQAFDDAPFIGQTTFKVVDTVGNVPGKIVVGLSRQPYLQDLMQAMGSVFGDLRQLLRPLSTDYERVDLAGIGLGDSYLGANISGQLMTGQETAPNKILVNPYIVLTEVEQDVRKRKLAPEEAPHELAKQLVGTILHELTHQQFRGHSEDFAGALTANQSRAILESASAYETVLEALQRIYPAAEEMADLLPPDLRGDRGKQLTAFTRLADDLNVLRTIWTPGREDIFKAISTQHGRTREGGRGEGAAQGGPEAGPRPGQALPGRGGPEGAALESRAAARGRPVNVRALADLESQERRTGEEFEVGPPKDLKPRIKPSPITGEKPAKIQDIAKRIQYGLQLPARTGKPGRGAIGVYKPSTSATLIRYSGDLDTMAHEMTHHLSDRYGLMKEWKDKYVKSPYDKELVHFWWHGSAAKSGPRSRLSYKREEGVAEFVRAWIVNPDAAEAQAPTFAQFFKDKVPAEVLRKLQTFSHDIRVFAGAPPHEQILANVDWKPEKTPLLSRILGPRVQTGHFEITWGDRLTVELQDKLKPFMKAVDFAAQFDEPRLPKNDPRILARLLMGVHARMDDIFDHGLTDAQRKRITPEGGFKWLFGPLDTSSEAALDRDMRDVSAYMIAQRTLEKSEQLQKGRVSGIGGGILPDVEVAMKLLADLDTQPERKSRLDEAARRYRQWADGLLRYLVDKGRLSEEQYDAIKEANEFYVAMRRVMELSPEEEIVGFTQSPGRQTTLGTVRQPIQPFHGSTREIKNPYAVLMEATYRSIQEADRNDVLRQFRDMLAGDRGMYEGPQVPLADVGRRAKEGEKNTIAIYVDGQRELWQFQTDVYEALKGLGQMVRLPGWATILPRILRNSIIYALPFAFRNFIRDTFQRTVVSDVGSLPWESVTELSPTSRERSPLAEFGGDQAGWYLQNRDHYYDRLGRSVRELVHAKDTILLDPRKLGQAYLTFMQQSERAGRMAEYRAAYKHAKDVLDYHDYDAGLYAAFKARDLLDFAVVGNTIQYINQLLPFTNAAIQGLARSARAIQQNPTHFMTRWGLYVLVPTLAVAFLASLMDDEDEYLKLPSYRRDLFWNVRLGPDMWLSIPKPFELGVAASGVERMIAWAKGRKNAFDGLGGSIARSTLPFDVGSLAGMPSPGLFEAAANYDFFRDRSIVPKWEEGLDLELRKGAGKASRLGQAIQQAIGVDARKVDFFIESQFGYAGRYAIQASDIGRAGERRPPTALEWIGLGTGTPGYSNPDVQWIMDTAERRGIHAAPDKQVADIPSVTTTTSEAKRLGVLRRHLDQFRSVTTRQDRDRVGRLVRQEAAALRELWEADRPETKKYRKEHAAAEHPATSALRDIGLLP